MKLFVGGLPWSIDDSSLKDAFAEFGTVNSAKVITDKFTGRSRGFGFVEMPDDEAKKAMEQLNGSEIDGRSIVVNVAEERKERSGGNRGGYGGGNRGGYGGRGNDRGRRSDY